MSDLFITEINDKIKIYQKKDGLTFGTDAYLLYAYMKTRKSAVGADLGSGTGVISLLAASKGKLSHIHAIEIQKDFCDIIDKNTELNTLCDKITTHNCDVRNIPDTLTEAFDVVFTNPPYMKADSGLSNKAESKNIARHEENGTIYDFAAAGARLLKYGGYFYAVYRPDRLCDLICALRENKLEPKRITFVHPTVSAKPCLVLVEAKKGAGVSSVVTRPLIMNDEDGKYTPELDYIYNNGEFDEQY